MYIYVFLNNINFYILYRPNNKKYIRNIYMKKYKKYLQPIIGEYDKNNNSIIVIFLSCKNYNVSILINNQDYLQTDIIAFEFNKIILKNIFIGTNYEVKILLENKIIEKFFINFISDPFLNVKILNCDSEIGFETNTWDLVDKEFGVVFHIGDFIYNDRTFIKIFYNIKYAKNEYHKNDIYKIIYKKYYKNVIRNNKNFILKNNINYIIMDDHEFVDNNFQDKYQDDKIFKAIYSYFRKFNDSLMSIIRISEIQKIDFIKSINEKSVYIMNNQNVLYSKEIINEYELFNKLKNFSNIIFLERKMILNYKPGFFSQIIFGDSDNSNNLIPLLDVINQLKNNNPNLSVLIACGDLHSKFKYSIIHNSNKDTIVDIRSCGAINTCVDIINNKYFIKNSWQYSLQKNKKNPILQNGYIQLFEKNNKIIISDIKNKKSYFYNLFNYTYSGSILFYYIYILKILIITLKIISLQI